MRTKTDQVAVSRERIAKVRGWIETRKAGKKAADLNKYGHVLACCKATGLRLSQIVDAARAIGARS